MIWQTLFKSGFDQLHVSPDGYIDWKQQARSLETIAAAFVIPEYGLNNSGSCKPERVIAPVGMKEFLPVRGINGPRFRRNGWTDGSIPSH
jgi:hypothetical protein